MHEANCFGSEKSKLPLDKPAGFMVVAESHGVARREVSKSFQNSWPKMSLK
jgi:hypothetical protein